jgi:hypothetical protein
MPQPTVVEVKFVSVRQTSTYTELTVRLFLRDINATPDGEGGEKYNREFLRDVTFNEPRGTTLQQWIDRVTGQVDEIVAALNLPHARTDYQLPSAFPEGIVIP